MPLETVEFRCSGGCGWYNYPRLNLEIEGEKTIVCGNCGHEHYRYVAKGKLRDPKGDFPQRITEQRGGRQGERIIVMKSACQKEPRKRGMIAKVRELLSVVE